MVLPSAPPRILVVEDDRDIAALVALHLADLPAQVELVHDGAEGMRCAREGGFAAMVLDLRLPSLGGLDVCRELRAVGSALPILMLTARNGELDRVLGLELGADDYLAKPFSVLELQARVKALLRRAARQAPHTAEPEALRMGPLHVDRAQRRARLDGHELTLAPREFDLLWHFMRHPSRVFTRTDLLADVWGYGHDGYDHTVNSHINRLRDKLGDRTGSGSGGRFIHTVWGVGYRFEVVE
jgi:DNA-binding response OmpR family regulator